MPMLLLLTGLLSFSGYGVVADHSGSAQPVHLTINTTTDATTKAATNAAIDEITDEATTDATPDTTLDTTPDTTIATTIDATNAAIDAITDIADVVSGTARTKTPDQTPDADEQLWFIAFLFGNHPWIVLILLAMATFYIYRALSAKNRLDIQKTIQRGLPISKEAGKHRSLDHFQARDENFNESIFLGRIKMAFRTIQAGWAQGNLRSIQAFLADGVFAHFSQQRLELREQGIDEHLENLHIHDARLLQIVPEDQFDTIYVAIRAQAIKFSTDSKTGQQPKTPTIPVDFEEIWSLVRSTKAQTFARSGLMEGFCPNCASSISPDRSATCSHCHSLLRSGEHDWVLAGITRPGEWSAAASTAYIPGVASLQSRDQNFNLHYIKDLAAVVFYQRILTQRRRIATDLRQFALERLIREMNTSLTATGAENRPFFGDCVIHAIEVRGVETSSELDRLFVEIRWTGRPYITQTDGSHRKMGDFIPPTRDIYVFIRHHDVGTELRSALTSAHCSACGNAKRETGRKCEKCNVAAPDNLHDWTLEKVCGANDNEIQATLKSLWEKAPARQETQTDSSTEMSVFTDLGIAATPSGEAAMFASGMQSMRWLIAMMLADGIIDQKERETLREFGEKCGITPTAVDEMISAMETLDIKLENMELPTNPQEGVAIFENMVNMALADGFLAAEEVTMLSQTGLRLGLVEYDVKMIISREQKRLYQIARTAMNEIRQQ